MLQPVVYRLVGRQLFHSAKSHFTAQLLLEGRTYAYDDMARSGVLLDVGDETKVTISTPETSFLVYHRISTTNVSSIALNQTA